MLEHMILSHHYEPEFGSPKKPLFPEAEVLHYLDILDARMFDMENALEGLRQGSFLIESGHWIIEDYTSRWIKKAEDVEVIKFDKDVLLTLKTLEKEGFETYAAGNCVRDLVRGLPAYDWDLVTKATMGDLQKLFPKEKS